MMVNVVTAGTMSGNFNLTRTAAITLTSAATAILIVIGAVVVARRQQRAKKQRKPSKWRPVGEITKIFIYPLKSGQVVELVKADCTDLGLKTTDDHPLKIRDRFFIVFSEESGNMKTARQHPQMVLIKVSYADGNQVTFEAPNMPVFKLKLPDKQAGDSKKKICKLWFEETVEAIDCGDEAAEWMSTFLLQKKSGARLGYHALDSVARRDFSKQPISSLKTYYANIEAHDSGAYADLASYMLMTEESVQELKDRVGSKVPALSPLWFRPNFVMRGSEPFAEDNWDWIRIGDDVILRNIKPCTRCILTTIDPETGIKNKSMEPLRTLKSYRKLTGPEVKLEGDSPAFGRYMALRHAGLVRLGDPVYVGE
ncbi:mitochondrial amidoxime-reducing component 1 isoform X2 [Anabrus simplex]|uniref:mitochondrial amidoxime-reducing component 1 isoform X2 n=1 Tax=Anabrus simplex TaxID=316456 RepID=UPI0035A29928